MIALFETLGTQAQLKEVANLLAEKLWLSEYKFEAISMAVQTKKAELEISTVCDSELYLELWQHLQIAQENEPTFPLAQNTLEADSQRLGFNFAKDTVPDLSLGVRERVKKFWSDGTDCLSFEDALYLEASRILGQLMNSGDLSDQEQQEIRAQVRNVAKRLDHGLADEALDAAIQTGDLQAIGAIIVGGSVAGLALAVELGGFAAYILAAKLSAFVPMVGGVGMVSFLAVLVNPITVAAAVLGGGAFAWQRNNRNLSQVLSRRLLVALALKGQGTHDSLLTHFRTHPRSPSQSAPKLLKSGNTWIYSKYQAVEEAFDGKLPAPYVPPRFSTAEATSTGTLSTILSEDGKAAIASGGIALADQIYTAWAIDPRVLQAANFSRSENINNYLDFSVFAQKWSGAEAASQTGFESNLQGYVAEQFVMTQLVQSGHSVELPSTSNMPGFDLIVDGIPTQVKCGQSLSLLADHFGKYDDVPVIANSELIEKAIRENPDWLHLLHSVEGFGLEPIRQLTETALAAGAGFVENSTIMSSILVTVGQQVWSYSKGQVTLNQLPTEIAVEAAMRGGAAWIGGLAGNALGILAFGPAGVVILGPLGGVAGLFGLGAMRSKIEGQISPEWLNELTQAASVLKSEGLKAQDIRIAKLKQVPSVTLDDFQWLVSRRQDAVIAETEARWALNRTDPKTVKGVLDVLLKIEDMALLEPKVGGAKKDVLMCLSRKPSVAEGALKRGKDVFAFAQKKVAWKE
ncbi:MAG: hypothetical protein ABJ263_01170 [Tateyamaria sp.]|uniref:hypothetical protein n=1 Tax=Tateyamaria sp. TaxID=1929288 RepID=UPI00328C59AC